MPSPFTKHLLTRFSSDSIIITDISAAVFPGFANFMSQHCRNFENICVPGGPTGHVCVCYGSNCFRYNVASQHSVGVIAVLVVLKKQYIIVLNTRSSQHRVNA